MSAHRFPHLAQRLFNVPLAILPGKADLIAAVLADRMGITLRGPGGEAVALAPMMMGEEPEPLHGYEVVAGVAIVPIEGTLVAKLGCLYPYSGMTGYDGIRQNLLAALDDDAVRAIVLDIDSPGGEVAGVFDLADLIYQVRGDKPIWAILTENAYSAAYALASAADRVIVPRTGGTGSIGVVCLHVDFSRALTQEGVTVTLIRHGDRKYEGNQYEPLTKRALQSLQADVDTVGELFCATVARNRGLAVQAVMDMEAGTYLGADGVTAGLADECLSPDEAFMELVGQLPD